TMRDTLTVIGNPIATASGQIRPAVDKGPAAGLVGRRRLRWIVPVAATYVFLRPPGPAQARVRCPAGALSLRLPAVRRGVALSWHAVRPGAVARRGSRRVCSSSK